MNVIPVAEAWTAEVAICARNATVYFVTNVIKTIMADVAIAPVIMMNSKYF